MEGKGWKFNKELESRSWHCGRQGGDGNLNKELDFRPWHCGRQGMKFKQRGQGGNFEEFDFR